MGDASYPAADTNFMGELVLYGKFVEIPECLFYRRMHAAASTADREDTERQTSFWGRSAPGFSFPFWRKHAAYLRAIQAAPVGLQEKRRLALYALRRMYWDKGEIFKELLSEVATKARLRH
jgi:hypothetical protein